MGKSDASFRNIGAGKAERHYAKHPCARWFPGTACPFEQHMPGGRCPLAEAPQDACEHHIRYGQCDYGASCTNAHKASIGNHPKADLRKHFLRSWKSLKHPCHLNKPGEPCDHDPCLFKEFPATACIRYALSGKCETAKCDLLHNDENGEDLRDRFWQLYCAGKGHICEQQRQPCILNEANECVLSALPAQPVCFFHMRSGECTKTPCAFAHEVDGLGDVRQWYVRQIKTVKHPCKVWFGECKYGDERCFFADFPGDSCYREVVEGACGDDECPLEHKWKETGESLRLVYQKRAGITPQVANQEAKLIHMFDQDSNSTPDEAQGKKRNYPPYFDDVERRNREVVHPCYEDPPTGDECGKKTLDDWFKERRTAITQNREAQERIDGLNANSRDTDSDSVKAARLRKILSLIERRKTTWQQKSELDRLIRLRVLQLRFEKIRQDFTRNKKVLRIDLHYFSTWYLCDVLKRLLLYSATLPGQNISSLKLVIYTGGCRTRPSQTPCLFEKLQDILANDRWMGRFVRVQPDGLDKQNHKVDVRLLLDKLREAYTIPSQDRHAKKAVSLKCVQPRQTKTAKRKAH